MAAWLTTPERRTVALTAAATVTAALGLYLAFDLPRRRKEAAEQEATKAYWERELQRREEDGHGWWGASMKMADKAASGCGSGGCGSGGCGSGGCGSKAAAADESGAVQIKASGGCCGGGSCK
eukprot:TRINITY_DN12793_c0_g2_i1.p1 TRINITY_DN12793_c0_g2~~TRINITY_DN12793_c0_g2_i1.p1  ORF type:complete len:123 (+),score=35.19 TRINITY_DN12793_c0_g2_i1:82-450(+)